MPQGHLTDVLPYLNSADESGVKEFGSFFERELLSKLNKNQLISLIIAAKEAPDDQLGLIRVAKKLAGTQELNDFLGKINRNRLLPEPKPLYTFLS